MPLSKKQTKTILADFPYTKMEPCTSRGIFKPYEYLAEALVAVCIGIIIYPIGIFIGAVPFAHAWYRLYNMNKMQAACLHCQAVHHKLVEGGKSFNCDSCGHRLGIYGTKLADLGIGGSKAGNSSLPWYLPSPGIRILSLLIFICIIAWAFGGGLDKQAANQLQDIKTDVADEAAGQYYIAQRNGNKMDRCVQAGLVTAAYLQANNETSYKIWKDTRDKDCRTAGVPVQ